MSSESESPSEHHLLVFIKYVRLLGNSSFDLRITDNDDLFSSDVTLGVSIPGVALTAILLFVIAYLRYHPASRSHLDRVSFRLLIYALVAKSVTFNHS